MKPTEQNHECTWRDFFELMNTNVIVNHIFGIHSHGYFKSTETMLITCICKLAEQNDELRELLFHAKKTEVPKGMVESIKEILTKSVS